MRPAGIAILSIFLLVIGALAFFGGLVLVVFSGIVAATPGLTEEITRSLSQLPSAPLGMHRMVAAELALVFFGLLIITMGIVMAVIGWGLWIGGNWARWIAIIFFGLSSLSSLSNLVQGQFGAVISLAINGLIVYYLFTPNVKKFFRATV